MEIELSQTFDQMQMFASQTYKNGKVAGVEFAIIIFKYDNVELHTYNVIKNLRAILKLQRQKS